MAKKNNKKRDDGRYQVQVFLGRDDNGKRKYKTVYGRTQKEADARAQEIRLALSKGLDVSAEAVTFSEWADRWLELKKPEVAAARTVVYECNLKHLLNAFGNVPISKIRPADVQAVITSLSQNNANTGRPMAKKTLKGIKSTAAQVFQFAIDNRVMDYNPARPVKITAKDSPSDRRALTPEEQTWITDTPHRAQLAAMLMMYAGLRRGELIALTWNDIDLEEGSITVNKAVEFVRGKPVLKDSTKTPAGIRTINIPHRLIDFLAEQPKQSLYVCINSKGDMHTASSWRRMWESYLAELNLKYGDFRIYQKRYTSKYDPDGVPFVIPKITPHWLRHTFCTMLYMAGVDILTAKNQMGHSDIQTTLEIYTHLDALHKRKEIDKLNAYLSDASQMQVNTN